MTTITNVIFPDMEKQCKETELYYRTKLGKAENKGDTLVISEGTIVSFDTFFNSIPYGKILKYTNIKEVVLKVTIKGHGKIRVLYRESVDVKYRQEKELEEQIKDPVCVEELEFNAANEEDKNISVDISAFEGQGILYFEIEALSNVAIKNATYLTSQERARKAKIGLVFCTFKREEYVKSNVKRIVDRFNRDKRIKDGFGVFVVDNGNTLKEEDVEGAFLFPNPNTGGSGGFTT